MAKKVVKKVIPEVITDPLTIEMVRETMVSARKKMRDGNKKVQAEGAKEIEEFNTKYKGKAIAHPSWPKK